MAAVAARVSAAAGAGSGPPGFFELWYICVRQIVGDVADVHRDADEAIAEEGVEEDGRHRQADAHQGHDQSVRDAVGQLGGVRRAAGLPSSMKLRIMPYTVPTRPSIGPSVPMVAR